MKKKTLIPLVCALFVFASTSHVVRAEEIQAKFISDDFVEALQRITPDYFFNDSIEPYERFVKGNIPFEGKDKAYKANKHYTTLSDQACVPLAAAMDEMLDDDIEGQEDIFSFNEELTKVMRAAGAYAFPIRFEKGSGEVQFLDKSWMSDTSEEETQSQFSKYLKNKGYKWNVQAKPDGILNVGRSPILAVMPSTALGYNEIIKDKKYELINYKQAYNFTQAYLFVLNQDPKDINSDRVYLFVEVPFKVATTKFGTLENLTKSMIAESRPGELRCYVGSKSGLAASAKSRNEDIKKQSNRDKKERFISILDVLPPITIPANEHYMDGVNSPYTIEASQVAEPYLRCWMSAFNLIEGVSGNCLSDRYADEYADMIQSDICGEENITKINRKFMFPYQYSNTPRSDVVVYRHGYDSLYEDPISCQNYETIVSKWSR